MVAYSLNYLGASDVLRIRLHHAARCLLLDDINFENYRRGRHYTAHGGWVRQSPTYMKPPNLCYRNLVLDLGGASGTITSAVDIIRPG